MGQTTETLQGWALARAQAPSEARLVPLAGDAGFRRYFRLQAGPRRLVVMDAAADRASCEPFVRIAGLLRAGGVRVPEVLATDVERGWLLLTDLGTQTYLEWLLPLAAAAAGDNPTELADRIMAAAIDGLLQIQALPCPAGLPRYDEALLRRELELFPAWYLERHCRLPITPAMRGQLDQTFDLLVEHAVAQPRVLVHRDYMPRNLMRGDAESALVPGVLDFQDAVCGPITYDPVCLFQDAFLSWPRAWVDAWLRRYWLSARARGLPVTDDWRSFRRDCDLMAAQRHLKVIGIFARICHRDGKPHYLEDVPRFVRYLREAVAHQAVLAPLGGLLETIWPAGQPA